MCQLTNGITVHHSPIEAYGQITGLPNDDTNYYIQAFIITDIEYPQDSCLIAEAGLWHIRNIWLGATNHKLFFRILDEDNRVIAETANIAIRKIGAF